MHSIQYALLGCHLTLMGEGVEGGDNSTITELEQFTLDLSEHIRVTGQQSHLEAMVETFIPYARYIISGQPRGLESTDGSISITPWHRGHRLRLQRSEEQTKGYDVQLDDGELANVVRFLDALIHDPRLQLDLAAPEMEGLLNRELLNRLPMGQRLVAPLGGGALVAVLLGLGLLLPVPEGVRVPSSDQLEGNGAVESVEEGSLEGAAEGEGEGDSPLEGEITSPEAALEEEVPQDDS